MLGLAAGLLLLTYPIAWASDVLSNVGPASQLPNGALADAYPIGNYGLDHHFDAVKAGVFSGVDVSGIPPTIAWFLAQMIWTATAFLAQALITLFTFAFSLDLVNGSSATGGAGALAPVSEAVRSIYSNVFGEPWLVLAILVTGLWAMWHALVRRRYTETAGALGVSVVFVVIALAFVAKPEIIAQASKWTNQMSSAFLALSHQGSVSGEAQAKQAAADQLFALLVYDPWVVLNFGGLEHCVRGSGDDVVSVPVRPLSRDPARDAELARRLRVTTQIQADGKVCVSNRNKYAEHFIRFPLDSDERNAEFNALNDGDTGKLPDADPSKADGSYRLGAIDKPAADAMKSSGQYQRLLLAVVVFVGELGAFLLLGSIAVVVILAQVLVLLVLAFAPVALVAGVVPGRGHDFFRGWLARLATFLLRKAIYSLILAVLLAVSAALADATSNLGWLLAFGMQAVFFWTVFLYRKQLAGLASRTVTGRGVSEAGASAGRIAAIYYAATRLPSRRGRDRRPRPRQDDGPASSAADEPPAPIDAETTMQRNGGGPRSRHNGSSSEGSPAPSPSANGRNGDRRRSHGDPAAGGVDGGEPEPARSDRANGDAAAPAPPPASADAGRGVDRAPAPVARAGADGHDELPAGGRRESSGSSPLHRSLDADAQRLRPDRGERAGAPRPAPSSARPSSPPADPTPADRPPTDRPQTPSSSAPSSAPSPASSAASPPTLPPPDVPESARGRDGDRT